MRQQDRQLVDRVEQTMRMIGRKWKPAIMFCLVFGGRQRFSELRRALPDISQKMLTQRLRELEEDGLVKRTFHEAVPPRVEYELTSRGLSLHPIYKAVCDWSRQQDETAVSQQPSIDAALAGK